jgi:N-acyl-D-aspartate/D-glutamate deacylase
MFDSIYPLGDPPIYEPAPGNSLTERARRAGVSAAEFAYDVVLQEDGKTLLFIAMANYVDGTLDVALQMIKHPNAILGLGDGGAHYGLLCDSSYPSFMLTYWCRDRVGEKLSVAEVVRLLSDVPARALGLTDRGRLAPGLRADLNIIDLDHMRLHSPRAHYDLPAGGRRVMQDVDGIRATLVNGVATHRDGIATSALPGRLIRANTISRLH